MTFRPDLLMLLVALAIASFACRAGGFWMMRFVAVTPRLEAALRAAPLAVMVGIVTPAATRGNVAELLGLGATALAMWGTRSELLATLAGVVAVAIGRQFQG